MQHYSGLEEAVFRNIRACKELSQTTRTAYGPNGKHPVPAVRYVCMKFLVMLCSNKTNIRETHLSKWISMPFRNEQNGHQPLGEAVCYQRCCNNSQRAWGEEIAAFGQTNCILEQRNSTVLFNVFMFYRCNILPPKWSWWHPTCKSRRLEMVQILYWFLLELCWSWLKSCSGWGCLCQR